MLLGLGGAIVEVPADSMLVSKLPCALVSGQRRRGQPRPMAERRLTEFSHGAGCGCKLRSAPKPVAIGWIRLRCCGNRDKKRDMGEIPLATFYTGLTLAP